MKITDLYITYLISQEGQSTATKLSKILNCKISHDKITKFLNAKILDGHDLWERVNRNNILTSSNEDKWEENDLIIDDTIISKPYRKENKHICWHYNHAIGRCEKGVNLMSCVLRNGQFATPINYRIINKTEYYKDKKTLKDKRKSKVTKNEHLREILKESTKKLKGKYSYILADNWFCSKDNINYIHNEIKKNFILGIKSNRLIQIEGIGGTQPNHFVKLGSANLDVDRVYRIRLKGVSFPLSLVKKVFKNGGKGNIGVTYLISNDITLTSDALYKRYQKRWRIEEYHRSLKQYVSVSKSPSRSENAQPNHIVLSMMAYSELELLGKSTNKSIHALRYELLLKSNMAAFDLTSKIQKSVA